MLESLCFAPTLAIDVIEIFSLITESPNVKVDDDGLKVKPNHTRCTVILREIPDDTEKHEVEVRSSAPSFLNVIF